MGDDISAIEQWAEIFEEPTKLAEKASKAWLLHKNKVKKDAGSIEADWESGLYFNSGVDVADLLTLVVGPIH